MTPAYTNPVHPECFAGPFVWRAGERCHAIGTGAADAVGTPAESCEPSVFPLLACVDLVHRERCGYAFVRPHRDLGDTFWAPEVVHAEGRWLLYYSVGHGDRRHQLRVAASEHVAGPYVDCAQLTHPDDVPFAIDPHPFRDDDGRWYLHHARDFLDLTDDNGLPVHAATALVVQPLRSPGPTWAAQPGNVAAADAMRQP